MSAVPFHVVHVRECGHVTADAREYAKGDLRCETCGAKVVARLCPQGAKR